MKIKKSQLQILVREIVCEALQYLQETQNGEWWLQGGYAQFADGDVGDSGHEGYVIEHLSREIYEHFVGNAPEEMGYLGEWEEDIWRALRADERVTEEDADTWANRGNKGGPLVVILAKLLEDKAYPTPEQTKDAIYIAYGSSRLDARDYAMRYLGWKRMDSSGGGISIQTWFLRPEDLEDIKRGIWDALGDSEYEPSGEEYEDEDQNDYMVEIEVRANNRQFSNIPLKVLSNASIRDLMDYRRELAWMREKRNVAPVMNPVNFV